MEQKKSFIIHAIYYLLILFFVVLGGYFIFHYGMTIVCSCVLVFMIKPFIDIVLKKLHVTNRFLEIVLIIIVYLGVLLLFLYGIVLLLGQLYALLQDSPSYVYSFCMKLSKHSYLSNYVSWIYQSFEDVINDLSLQFVQLLIQWISKIPSFFFELIFSLFISLFLLLDYQNIRTLILNHRYEEHVLIMIQSIKETLGTMFKTYSILFFITWIELYLGFLIMKIPNNFFLAFSISFFDFLPVLGIDMIFVPWIIYVAFQNQIMFAFGLLLLYGVVVITKNVLEPKLLSHRIGLSPALTLICIYLGMKVFGVLGVFLVPTVVMIVKRYLDIKK